MPHFASSTKAPTKPPVRKTLVAQDLGQDDVLVGEVEAAVVPHAVSRGKLAGEDRRVRGQGQRRHRLRLLEQDSLGRQAVEVRRFDVGEAVGADAVGPGRVEGDEEQAQVARGDAVREPAEGVTGRGCDLAVRQEADGEQGERGDSRRDGYRRKRPRKGAAHERERSRLEVDAGSELVNASAHQTRRSAEGPVAVERLFGFDRGVRVADVEDVDSHPDLAVSP